MSRHKKSGKKQTPKNFGGKHRNIQLQLHNLINIYVDITINDFANSVSSKSRPRKSTSNVAKVLKEIEVEKAWDEKEVYEGDFDFVEQDNEDGTVCYVARKVNTILGDCAQLATTNTIYICSFCHCIILWRKHFRLLKYLTKISVACSLFFR